ncbi:unnamed protein product [Lactuca saligna]|uniref:Myb-like domain-containing protein n=1 Tax=Lactuca saligna TaxID=75948 RepID=A0AA35ZMZ0_LACSI|nr:unnamed protein product [Lactuca saligna]
MDGEFPKFHINFGDSQNRSNAQYFENSSFFSNPNQNPVTNNLQTSQNTEKQPRGNNWDAAEDVAIMSAWCFTSEDKERGKNQKKKASLWAQIKQLYDAARVENTEKLNSRNEDQTRGRFKRLSENAQKWVDVYREA